ncbi:MAG TPA: hypothetical protein VIQ30_02555 [Pseudonocardia sp.]
MAAAVFDAVGPSSAGATQSSGTSLTWSHTCTGTNLLLVVGVAIGAGTDSMTTSVTYNGVAMTSAIKVHAGNSTSGYIQFFYLLNPATGAHTVAVTLTAAATISAGSVSYTGVDQTTPFGTFASAFSGSTGTAVSVAVPSTTSGNPVIDAMAQGSGSNATVGGGQTLRWQRATNGASRGGCGAQSTETSAGGTTTMSYTLPFADHWAIVAAEIKGAATAFFGSATATLTLAASSTATSSHSGAPTATVRLDTSATTTAAKNVAPAAATLILAATGAGSPAKNVAVDATPLILSATATGAKINLGLAVLTLSASMASPLHHGIASRTAPAVLQATVAGTHRATSIGPIAAVLLLTTSADTVSDHFGGPTDPATLFLSAAANAERIITEVTQAIQSRASLSVQYELVCMARIPQTTGPPLLLAVDPIDWTGLSYTDELSKPQQLQAGCQISGLTDAVVQRLRNLDELATELWLYRLGKLVFAGPLLGWQVQGEALTFNAAGLLAYLKMMVIQKDLVFSQVDQFTMAQTMVDQWQTLDYGNFGIDTSTVGASGVLRDGTYLQKELHNVHQRVTDLGARQNGFDVSVDPASRRFTLDYPIKGVDRSGGEDAIVFDDRNVTSPNIVASAAPGDVASEGYGTGTNTGAGGDTILSVASNLELRARYGRTAVTATFDGVSQQDTLDAYTQGLIDARGNVLLVPGPNVRVTPDSDLGSYDVGDTVSYQLHSRLSVAGAFRIRKRQVTVSKTGQESTSIQFV